jgi:hypothetical protein
MANEDDISLFWLFTVENCRSVGIGKWVFEA